MQPRRALGKIHQVTLYLLGTHDHKQLATLVVMAYDNDYETGTVTTLFVLTATPVRPDMAFYDVVQALCAKSPVAINLHVVETCQIDESCVAITQLRAIVGSTTFATCSATNTDPNGIIEWTLGELADHTALWARKPPVDLEALRRRLTFSNLHAKGSQFFFDLEKYWLWKVAREEMTSLRSLFDSWYEHRQFNDVLSPAPPGILSNRSVAVELRHAIDRMQRRNSWPRFLLESKNKGPARQLSSEEG
ncbi:hypothetical protein AK812_SmicGene8878 [Symbiodinium microadriaticum]|uniref:Uncharacterized protein n=1 Tax=Symbiodinium microadriaticum TaxID=2951 RepID=A0A1Q9EJU6_SYMMI|nr:hypothetical protein AK812_SmicGene8878 [Symbiodinium microadriaticum]